MAEKQAVFVILTAADCSHCVIFKKDILPALTSRLERDGKVLVEKVEVPSMGNTVIPADKPAGLATCTKYFPMLLLISKSAWDEGMRNRGTITNLRPIPFNIKIDKGQWIPLRSQDPGFYVRDVDGISSWINANLSKLPSAAPTPQTSNQPPARPLMVNNPPPAPAPITGGRSKGSPDTCNVRVIPAKRR